MPQNNQIRTREEWEASRKISNALAALLRSGAATASERNEFEQRDAAEHAWKRANAPAWTWGKQFGARSCDEIGLMP